MHRTVRSLARVLSGPLAALMLVMSVAAPVYERADFGHELAIESEHDPATCPPAHDHSVCAQVSANAGAASNAPEHRFRPLAIGALVFADAADHASAGSERRPRSRAPPTV